MKATLTVAHGDRSMLQFRGAHSAPTADIGRVLLDVGAHAVNFADGDAMLTTRRCSASTGCELMIEDQGVFGRVLQKP